MANCKYCGKPIIFIETEKRKQMPAEPGIKTFIEPRTGEISEGFIVHWSNCPKAQEAKKRNKS